MCLRINTELTEDIRQGTWPRTCYKVLVGRLIINSKILTQPKECHLGSFFAPFLWKPGTNQSSRIATELGDLEVQEGRVSEGFHVYLERHIAERNTYADSVIVPVECQKDDFVVAGFDNHSKTDHSAIFTKVTIDPKEYEAKVRQIERFSILVAHEDPK